jgi:hypothetical protein
MAHTTYEAGFAKSFPRSGSVGARAESRARGTGAVYGASEGSCDSVAASGDGAFVITEVFVLYYEG